jgi:GR25 family glycosyltransferase involved in LPS biosynthesis
MTSMLIIFFFYILIKEIIIYIIYFIELVYFSLEYYIKKNYCDLVTIDSIYCINLKSSTTRRQYIKDEEIKINKKINIFEAIDGKILSVKEQNKLHPNKITIFTHNFKITDRPRTMACSTSHMVLLKSLQKNNDNVLILEDDIIFKSRNFINDFEKISQDLPDNWDIIFFNPDRSTKKKNFFIDLNRNFYYLRKTTKYNKKYITLGGYCYLVNKNSIHKIIKHPITDDIDVLLTKINLNIYITKENYVEHNYNLISERE